MVYFTRGGALGPEGWIEVGSWLARATRLTSLDGFNVAQLIDGQMQQLCMTGMEGLPVAVAEAKLLQPSAMTLKSVDFRCTGGTSL